MQLLNRLGNTVAKGGIAQNVHVFHKGINTHFNCLPVYDMFTLKNTRRKTKYLDPVYLLCRIEYIVIKFSFQAISFLSSLVFDKSPVTGLEELISRHNRRHVIVSDC